MDAGKGCDRCCVIVGYKSRETQGVRLSSQNGHVSVEYLLAYVAIVLALGIGVAGEKGIARVFRDAFSQVYVSYSKMIGNMDVTP